MNLQGKSLRLMFYSTSIPHTHRQQQTDQEYSIQEEMPSSTSLMGVDTVSPSFWTMKMVVIQTSSSDHLS